MCEAAVGRCQTFEVDEKQWPFAMAVEKCMSLFIGSVRFALASYTSFGRCIFSKILDTDHICSIPGTSVAADLRETLDSRLLTVVGMCLCLLLIARLAGELGAGHSTLRQAIRLGEIYDSNVWKFLVGNGCLCDNGLVLVRTMRHPLI